MPNGGIPQGRLRALFEAAGADWLDLPVLHPADPFLETAGEDIRRRMFVTEGRRGESLALRPDFTIPVCVEHLRRNTGPRRYAYEGLVFRRHDGGAPERLETGYEDIGAEGADADADAVALAVAGAGRIAAGPISVRVGDIGLFVALLKALHLPGRWRRRLRHCFGLPDAMAKNLQRLAAPPGEANRRLDPELRQAAELQDRHALAGLLARRAAEFGLAEGLGRSPGEIADRLLDQRALPDAALAQHAAATLRHFLGLEAELARAEPALRAFAAEYALELDEPLRLFSRRADAIARRTPAADLRFEAGFGRPLDYYTGLVFELRAGGLAVPVAGGGRYDRLMEMLGSPVPVPAVGFTIRLDLPSAGDAR